MTRRTPAASQRLDPRHVADAATKLHRQIDRGENARDSVGVDRPSGEGTVEVDNVQPLEPGVAPRLCLRCRIVGVDRRLIHLAAAQPHAATVLQVDRRIQRQGHYSDA